MTTYSLRDTDGCPWHVRYVAPGDPLNVNGAAGATAARPAVEFAVGEPDETYDRFANRALGVLAATSGAIGFPELDATMDAATAATVREWARGCREHQQHRDATTASGLDPIVTTLAAAGVEHGVENTGGWVMAVVVQVVTGTYVITREVETFLAFYPGSAWRRGGEASIIDLMDDAALRMWAHTAAIAQTATVR